MLFGKSPTALNDAGGFKAARRHTLTDGRARKANTLKNFPDNTTNNNQTD